MDCLPKDIVSIIYRLLQSDLYCKVKDQFNTLYVSKWSERYCCYAHSTHDLIASWRRCLWGTYKNSYNSTYIFDMLDNITYKISRRGGTEGHLSDNY